jgi:hypothetical protein
VYLSAKLKFYGSLIYMGRPPKPIEQKRLLGNPGQRKLPDALTTISVPGGYVPPLRELGEAGLTLWESIFEKGELWISSRTDTHFLQMVCEQHDRRQMLMQVANADPENWRVFRQLHDLEVMISNNMGKLGLTPADRTKLGYAEVKARSKLEELQHKWSANDQLAT